MSELLGIARFKFLEGKREEYLRLAEEAGRSCGRRTPARWDTTSTLTAISPNAWSSSGTATPRRRSRTPRISGTCSTTVLATVTIVHGELLGEPSDELRANLAGSDVPVLFTPYWSM